MLLGALIGGATSLALVALFHLGQELADLPFVPFDVFDWLARALPGTLVTLFIDFLVALIGALGLGPTGEVAKLAQQLVAIGLVVAGGAVFGAAVAWAVDRVPWPGRRVGALGGLLLLLLVLAVESSRGFSGDPWLAVSWLTVLIVGWGALVGQWVQVATVGQRRALGEAERIVRRDLLVKISLGSVGIAVGALGLASLLRALQEQGRQARTPTGPIPSDPLAAAGPLPPSAATAVAAPRIDPAAGTRSELTPNQSFYRIDINTRPVVIDGETWTMEVDGLFDRPRPITRTDLLAYPPATQAITLSCISNPVGGDLIGTSIWTGVRLPDLLEDLGVRAEARALQVVAADGFFESVALEDMRDPRTLLVYAMNGEPLPVDHGFPLRIYIPNRYGMKQPKWITRIEAIDSEGRGYWVVRGWSKEARPHIVSVIDTIAVDREADGRIPIGGIAWAGDRGIQKVEVQVDDGPWEVATLRTPPLGPLTWVQWRYDWPRSAGRHSFRARATDGTGALQTERRSPVHPDGATGYHQVTRVI